MTDLDLDALAAEADAAEARVAELEAILTAMEAEIEGRPVT